MSTMGSSRLWGKIIVLIVVCSWPLPAQAKYAGGSGTEAEPYRISAVPDWQELMATPADWASHFVLTGDLDLDGVLLSPVGNDPNKFTGVFDGNDYVLRNADVNMPGSDCVGLFGYLGSDGQIKNLGVVDISIVGKNYVGGLVGQNGVCYHQDECHGGKMSNCYSTGTVSGYSAVGGLVGKSNGGTICNCCSESIVSGTTGVGGLLGDNEEGAIFNSYSHSGVSGNEQVAGLLGSNYWGTVTSSYSTGIVTGDGCVGGLVGYNDYYGTIITSFWDIETSGQSTSAGGTGKTTAEMQDPSTFMDAGWDFVGKTDGPHDVWAEPADGGYPILFWQLPPFFGLPGFSGGLGTNDEPYLISTTDELNSIGHNPRLMAAHFKLINDIDLTGTDLFLIGSELFPFRGVFDGNGKKISNFTFSDADADQIGLFRCVYGENAQIKDLGLIAPDVEVDEGTESWAVGSLVGWLYVGTITNCYVDGGSVSGDKCVGGLVGDNNRGTITNCHATASVSGNFYVGGLVGNNPGTISNCYSTGSVSGGRWYVGGLVGYNNVGTITNCYSTGAVSGGDFVGGLVGHNFLATITNCHTTGAVSGGAYVGGLVGSSYSSGKITKCCATGKVKGVYYVGGLVGSHSSTMTNCYATGDVRGNGYLGGLVGQHSYGTITNCSATGDASGTGWCVGGLVGQSSYGTITNCYAKGGASGVMYVGGLTGWNEEGTITDCYSTGGVLGTRSNVGGLAGMNSGTVLTSFWDIETSGISYSAGGTGKTTAEMKTQSTFTSAGWDFIGETANGTEDIWAICEFTNYPRFVWQIPQGDIVCPDGVNSLDFALLARYWHETDCAALDDCDGADIDLSGAVDFGDVAAITESWLRDVR